MRNFILGMIVTLLVLGLGALAVASYRPTLMQLRLGSNTVLP